MSNDVKISFTQKRREICDKCEHLTTMIGANVCNKCGCSVWAKTMIPNAKCPEGKWDEN